MARKRLASPGEALLADILANPDDDAPRLVYADWLDEHGGEAEQARAEFIRVQCEAAGNPNPARRAYLKQREQALLKEHGAAWWTEVPAWARKDAEFRRGFIAGVSVTLRAFLDGLGSLHRYAPVQRATLGNVEDGLLVTLSTRPGLAFLRAIRLEYGPFSPAGARALTHSPHAAGLAELDATLEIDGPGVADALVTSPPLGRLERLTLRGGPLGAAGARHLAAGGLPALRQLRLFGTKVGNAGTRALAESPHRAELTHLELWANEVGDEGAIALANSPHLHNLRELHLGLNWHITDTGIAALAAVSSLARLESLDLCHAALGPAGVEALVTSPHLRRLTYLRVALAGLPDESRRALQTRFGSAVQPGWQGPRPDSP
jgi:uncharacterized protein (TIGR02996 family)